MPSRCMESCQASNRAAVVSSGTVADFVESVVSDTSARGCARLSATDESATAGSELGSVAQEAIRITHAVITKNFIRSDISFNLRQKIFSVTNAIVPASCA